jgi:hypothetical protein
MGECAIFAESGHPAGEELWAGKNASCKLIILLHFFGGLHKYGFNATRQLLIVNLQTWSDTKTN